MQTIHRDQHTFSLSPAHPPVATVALGEHFRLECPSALGGVIDEKGVPIPRTEQTNAAAGPVFIAGIQPGDSLAIRLHTIKPVGWGLASGVSYRPDSGSLYFLNDIEVPQEPSLGVIGVAPRVVEEATSNNDSGAHGGNLDCRDFAVGATIFFAARVAGGLLGMGDAHLAMGDGELGGQGIESAVDVEASVVKAINPGLDWSWVVRDGWVMTLGGDVEYRRAQQIAYEGLITLGENLFNLNRREVHARIAPAGHLNVCQGCCPVMTVRVRLPLAVFAETEETFLARILET